MNTFAYSSYKHQIDQELLYRLGRDILTLKLSAQKRLEEYGLDTRDLEDAYEDLGSFLDDLILRTRLFILEPVTGDVNMRFTSLSTGLSKCESC